MASIVYELETYRNNKWTPLLREDGRIRHDFYAFSESGLLESIAYERPCAPCTARIVRGLDIVSEFSILPKES